jgi:hypothetical protein
MERLTVEISAMVAVLLAGAGLVAAGASGQGQSEGPKDLGTAAQLEYQNCYEHVGAFRVPVSYIRELVGSELPAGFTYQTFPPDGLGQLNVVGLDCDQRGHRVTDLLVNAPTNVPGTLVRVRTYTDSPKSRAWYGRSCFGGVSTLGDVDASVEIDEVGTRHGRVAASDGATSVEFTTTVPPSTTPIAAATLRHFAVKDGEIHGLIEWGSLDPGVRHLLLGPDSATLEIDGATPPGMTVVGAQHVHAEEGQPHTFFHRSLTRCAPGLDWRN